MAHFSIWIPNAVGQAEVALAQAGLGELVAEGGDLSPSGMPLMQAGPSGGTGLLVQWIDPFCAGERGPRLGYHPEMQAWRPLPAFKVLTNGQTVLKPQGTSWIGFERDRPLIPTDLLRRAARAGEPRYRGQVLRLGDGQDWCLPNQWSLPMEFAIDPETGEDKKSVTQVAQPVWERMQIALSAAKNAFVRDQHQTWTELSELPEEARAGLEAPEPLVEGLKWTEYDVHDFLIWGLSLNYRVCKLIAVTLRLFSNENLWPALFEMTDVLAIWRLQEVQKNWTIGCRRGGNGCPPRPFPLVARRSDPTLPAQPLRFVVADDPEGVF